jgi:fructose-1,6-bisphosphatase/inositol monophosphatase family enzyme
MTIAENISRKFHDDGEIWVVEGQCFQDACEEADAHIEQSANNRYRYVFPDGSVLVESDGGWDYEGDRPFSWRG